jgi:imidazolonepropionase-like amidohydrolase
MNPCSTRLLATLLLFSAVVGAPTAPETVALINGMVLDVRSGAIASGRIVLVSQGKIVSVGSAPAPAGTRTVDLKGGFLLPGLIDAHTHLANLAAARVALESGVTTVRSSGVSH